MIGEITYSWTPPDWSQDKFLRLGGFTVVFLNYNKIAQIRKSVTSTLAQNFPLLEMFFMDDASTDGSGDEMERLVREYRGRHKVMVVRNTENQRIAGQWNIVSKLATGNWFGMFCADDVQFPNRVTLVAERITHYPHLKGICTAVMMRDYDNGEKVARHHYNPQPWTLTGEVDDPRQIENVIDGASSFWHRSLFDRPLPAVNLDDMLIRWILQAKCEGQKDVVWTWASDLITLEYAKGTGITSKNVNDKLHGANPREQWIMDSRQIKDWFRLVVLSHRGIDAYFRENHVSTRLRHQSRWSGLMAESIRGNTVDRIRILPELALVLASVHLPVPCKLALWSLWIKKLVQEFFGLGFAAWVSARIRGRKCR